MCPGINRALEVRKKVGIQGIDRFGDPKTYQVPICGIGPLLVLKLNAFAKRSSGKRAKDAYDLLVAVSSYADGPRAAIDAFHVEAVCGNAAFERAARTLRDHFMRPDQEGPLQALQFRFGSADAGEDGVRLKEDLVRIGKALVDFE